MTDQTLLIAFLVAAHLTADFVVQTDRNVAGRNGSRGQAARSLTVHALAVGGFMLPFWLAFGTPGFAAVLLVAVPHPFIDAAKTSLNNRLRTRSPGGDWSPRPAALFLLDQAAHAALLLGAWWFLLRDAAVNPWLADRVNQAIAGAAASDVDRVAQIAVVGWSLLIVNTRAARFLVPLLLPVRMAAEGGATGSAAASSAARSVSTAAPGYTVKLGPLSGRIEQDPTVVAVVPGRGGAVIGILERLLVVVLVLGRAEAGIGIVVAVKTLARFKELDDRYFTETYIVGTLASVTIAVASALFARFVLFGA
jgi:Protein of unknown function (DUF3307)